MPPQTPPQPPFEMGASHQQLLGSYANVALIRHTQREFIFDFLLRLDVDAALTARIITSPQHAKEFQKALAENIRIYEEKNGQITLP